MAKKIGVIGLGSIALRHRKNLKLLFPQSLLVAVPSRQREVEGEVQYADIIISCIDNLIQAKPDFVIIASPAPFHYEHAKALIVEGVPLLIEKPVTSEYQQAIALFDLAKQYNTPIAVGYCLRYLSSSKVMKTLLAKNTIGSVYNAFINIGQFLPDWRPAIDYRQSVSACKSLGGGALLELSHELDYARWLLGTLEVENVILRGSKELDIDVEAFADISLSNEDGVICHIHLDFLQKKCQRRCSFIGSEGRLDWDLLENTISMHNAKGVNVLYSDPSWDKNNMYLAMIEDFIALIENKNNNSVTLKEAVGTVQLIDQLKLQAHWRKSI